MATIVLLIVVSGIIGGFAYYTNAGFGDRRPRDLPKKNQASAGAPDDDAAPPPHK